MQKSLIHLRAVAYLSRLCHRWGGELRLVADPVFIELASPEGRTLHPSGSHAIDREARLVIVARRGADPGAIIHEMGHVFLESGNPSSTYEPDWLGWEIALARRARCFRIWSRQMADYNVGFNDDDREWASYDRKARAQIIEDRLDYAKEQGLLSPGGVPLCTRRAVLSPKGTGT